MIIQIRNLGVISSASVSTAGNLTVLCGPNSTGKTYLSYMLYHLFSDESFLNMDYYRDIIHSAKTGNILVFSYTKQMLDDFLNAQAVKAKTELGVVFGIANDEAGTLFGDLDLNLCLTEEDYKHNQYLSGQINAHYNNFTFKILLNEEPCQVRIEKLDVNPIPESEEYKVWSYLICLAFRRVAMLPVHKPWMLTVERNSIYSFSKELSNYHAFDDYSLNGDDILRMTEFGPRRYPLAIRRSLRYASDLENIKKGRSPFYEYAVELEERLLHGIIESNQNGEIEFVIGKTSGDKHIPIHLTSSIVKTMASLILHLKYSATPNDIIIIDEPEINLHPDNQIVLTRVLGELINKGLRLIISTHSDYIVREFNNMMMARELKSVGNESYRVLGYQDGMLLDKQQVKVYIFKIENDLRVTVQPARMDRYGFSVGTIDQTIRQQNEATDTLHDVLKYDYPEL